MYVTSRLYVRALYRLLTGKYSPRRFCEDISHYLSRTIHNKKIINNIDALMDFDRAHCVKATYFFGMNQGLGLTYHPKDAKPFIERVKAAGFDAGVHGIVFDDFDGMKSERNTWADLMGTPPDCIRNHYVRFDSKTFERMSQLGYVYDSTEFDKAAQCTIKAPYKVGNMWEFPLNIMDGYLHPRNILDYRATTEGMKSETLRIIGELRSKGINYLTVLFHDPGFCEHVRSYMDWYKWLISYVEETPGFEFVSYREAIARLEASHDGSTHNTLR